MRTLVFVHGRSQQGRRDEQLKLQWLDALQEGFRRADLELKVLEDSVRFPFYGDALRDLSADPEAVSAQVVIQSAGDADAAEKAFLGAVVEDAVATYNISDEDIRAHMPDGELVEMGPQNWPWVLAALRVIEKVPGAGAATLALATRDVYDYLNSPGIQTRIEQGVLEAFADAEECVVVGHSLGSVIAYNVLQRRAAAEKWTVPSLITVGSPLGVRPVVEALAPVSRPEGVIDWFNAYDEHDVVALHPLDPGHFPVQPEVENYGGVDNGTPNQHGISGYLSDRVVAKRIHDALLG
ncbi:alpha/beta hydrolase [Blastococcus sp. CT_GayMR20]|uniref:alpha/beta hydrolase n=1 Tax=Blastococcus sp. CT_GayMR20 TaxID=2559609 RepID=UPI0010734DAA|nr:alpha/beta hydrolase [Blastococcus sp. CT_GayMR20]TFV92690.1 alpha/beta hydrolase [Blastococcus sp. CT_GayMR20]TFV92729.1 alpha/beta hydrolase [Blastococcus sp. CT_GayMR20]